MKELVYVQVTVDAELWCDAMGETSVNDWVKDRLNGSAIIEETEAVVEVWTP